MQITILLKHIILSIIPCIMVYYLTLPFIEPSNESMYCDKNYVCKIEQKYLGYNKTKIINLDKNISKLVFKIKISSVRTARGARDTETYKTFLSFINENNGVIFPFKKEISYKYINLNLKTQNELIQEREGLNQEINSDLNFLQSEFEQYLANPQKGFNLSSEACSEDVFSMYPIVLMFLFLGVGFFIIGKAKKII